MTFTAWRPDGTKIADQQPLTGGPNGFGQIVYGWDVPDDEAVSKLSFTPPVPMPPDAQPGYAFVFEFDYAVPCPPMGDTLFDNNASIRQGLNREFATATQEQRERGGWILLDEAAGTYEVWFDPNAIRDRCNFFISEVPPNILGKRGIAIWHTHWLVRGQQYGAPCRGRNREGRVPAGVRIDQDFPITDKTRKAHFVIDERMVFAIYPGNPPGAPPSWIYIDWINGCRATA
jgi:hypothetical protein